jgi:HK97 gp10 family phage protein
MTYTSRFDKIIAASGLRAQKAVEFAGQEIEFHARARARKDTGDMAAGIEWRPDKTGKPEGRVVATDWKTHFWEFGTVKEPAQPMLVPATETARPGFLNDMSGVYE